MIKQFSLKNQNKEKMLKKKRNDSLYDIVSTFFILNKKK